MNGPAYDADTLAFYSAEAATYAASEAFGVSRHLSDFLARLRPGARILELGCGGGRDTKAMIAAGFDVDPTDGCAEMAAQAKARIGRPVRTMRFDQLDAVAEYDAIWANACLLHVPADALSDILARIYRALKPGGWHCASYKVAGGDEGVLEPGKGGRDCLGRYYNFPAPTALLDAYRSAGRWVSIDTGSFTGGGYDGVVRPWIAVTARA